MTPAALYLHILNWCDTAIGVVSYLSILAVMLFVGAIAAGII